MRRKKGKPDENGKFDTRNREEYSFDRTKKKGKRKEQQTDCPSVAASQEATL